METRPLIVIVGPTASGKTSLAIKLAQKMSGEIICADSRTVYKDLDIGTAKPTRSERATVPHWGLDLVEPNQKFSAADFKKYALEKIEEIRKRNHVPFLVGGTGLYIDAVIFDYQFGPQADSSLRKELETMTVEELQKYCIKNNITLPENHKNKRYLIRAIEQKSINNKRRDTIIDNTYVVGIDTDKSMLQKRIQARAEQIFTSGVVEEAYKVGKKYGWQSEAMTGNIYPLCQDFIEGKISLVEAKQKFLTLDWRLAKRQLTWFRRNQFIRWLSPSEAEKYIMTILASEH